MIESIADLNTHRIAGTGLSCKEALMTLVHPVVKNKMMFRSVDIFVTDPTKISLTVHKKDEALAKSLALSLVPAMECHFGEDSKHWFTQEAVDHANLHYTKDATGRYVSSASKEFEDMQQRLDQ